QLRDAVPARLPAVLPVAAAGARLAQPDHAADRVQRPPAAAVRRQPADQRRVPDRPRLRARHLVAAGPDHHRVRVPQRGRERVRRPGGRHEGGTLLGAGDADRRRARRAGRRRRHPGHRLHPEPAELRHLRDRRDHRRAARPRPSRGSGGRGPAVRRAARGLAWYANGDLHAGADRAGAAGADRPLRRRAAADPRHVPAPRGPGRRGRRLNYVQGVERVTTSPAPANTGPATPARLPVLLPPEPGGASRLGRFAAPITYAIFGLVNILVFGLNAHGDATFAFSPQFAKVSVPNLSLPAAVTCFVLGAVTLALAVVRLLAVLGRVRLSRAANRVMIGVVLFAFVVSLMAWADAGQTIAFNVVNLLQGTLNDS